jgi:integration host factor subunit alpha
MARKTIKREDLYRAVYQKVRLSRTECVTLVELVLKEITDCLERGETVKLSRFGAFVVRKKGQRMGRNPRTGEEVKYRSPLAADLSRWHREIPFLRDDPGRGTGLCQKARARLRRQSL